MKNEAANLVREFYSRIGVDVGQGWILISCLCITDPTVRAYIRINGETPVVTTEWERAALDYLRGKYPKVSGFDILKAIPEALQITRRNKEANSRRF